MTLSTSKRLLLTSLLLFVLLQNINFIFAQTADTIIIYEYVRVVDTIWVSKQNNRDIIHLEKLQPVYNININVINNYYENNNEKKSAKKSATFSENSLLLYRQQNIPTMSDKVLQSENIQSDKFSRIKFSLNAGLSNSWLQHKTSTINNPIWMGAHLGCDVALFLKNNRWSISMGVTAHQVQPTSNYEQTKEVDISLSKLEFDFAQINTNIILNELSTGLFNSSYYQFSAPLKLSFHHKKWSPFIGGEYSYIRYNYKIPQSYKLYIAQTSKMKINFNDIAIIAGTKYSFSKNIGVSVEASQGMLQRHNYFNDNVSPTLGISEYYFRSLNLNFNVIYTFKMH